MRIYKLRISGSSLAVKKDCTWFWMADMSGFQRWITCGFCHYKNLNALTSDQIWNYSVRGLTPVNRVNLTPYDYIVTETGLFWQFKYHDLGRKSWVGWFSFWMKSGIWKPWNNYRYVNIIVSRQLFNKQLNFFRIFCPTN